VGKNTPNVNPIYEMATPRTKNYKIHLMVVDYTNFAIQGLQKIKKMDIFGIEICPKMLF
jgi:hypothetical protein